MPNSSDFQNVMNRYHHRLEQLLPQLINKNASESLLLCEAMVHATCNGGKRLRPILVYAVGECLGQSIESLDVIAAALEYVHCYSLIHDDLPAMDDDHLRRGKPTCHIIFDEATAILAGDGLHSLAFELLSKPLPAISSACQLQLIQTLAHYAGAGGMIAGQSLDLQAEGKNISAAELETIHRLKTGCLIKASIILGALGAGCMDTFILTTLEEFANRLGLAFQLQDDLLDATGNTKKIGKTAGKDVKQRKATYVTLFGIADTQLKINQLMQEAFALLKKLKKNTAFLEMLCQQLIQREY